MNTDRRINRRTSPIFTYASELREKMMVEFRGLREQEYAAASEATNGVLLKDWSRDSWDVYLGPQPTLQKYASEELLEYLQSHPRKSRQKFEKEWLLNYLEGVHGSPDRA